MTRPAADDGSDDPTPAPVPDPGPDAGVVTDALVLAAAAAAAIAARARADAERLADVTGAVPVDAALTAEADAVAGAGTRLSTELAGRGVDLDAAAASLTPVLRAWVGARPGRDAAEALVGGRLARGLVADLGAALGGDTVTALLAGVDDPLAEPAARIVAEALTDRRTRDRLALLARRMLGEALVLLEELLAALPAAESAVEAAEGGRRAAVKRIKSAHGRRVGALGL